MKRSEFLKTAGLVTLGASLGLFNFNCSAFLSSDERLKADFMNLVDVGLDKKGISYVDNGYGDIVSTSENDIHKKYSELENYDWPEIVSDWTKELIATKTGRKIIQNFVETHKNKGKKLSILISPFTQSSFDKSNDGISYPLFINPYSDRNILMVGNGNLAAPQPSVITMGHELEHYNSKSPFAKNTDYILKKAIDDATVEYWTRDYKWLLNPAIDLENEIIVHENIQYDRDNYLGYSYQNLTAEATLAYLNEEISEKELQDKIIEITMKLGLSSDEEDLTLRVRHNVKLDENLDFFEHDKLKASIEKSLQSNQATIDNEQQATDMETKMMHEMFPHGLCPTRDHYCMTVDRNNINIPDKKRYTLDEIIYVDKYRKALKTRGAVEIWSKSVGQYVETCLVKEKTASQVSHQVPKLKL